MSIADQLRADIQLLNQTINDLKSNTTIVQQNGRVLEGDERIALVSSIILAKEQEVLRLEAMLESRIPIKEYTSPVTKKTYVSPNAEAAIPNELPFALYYGFCQKNSRKTLQQENSEFNLEHYDGSPILNFKMEHDTHKNYPHGGYSKKVKKGFVLSEKEPRYAVKVFKNNLFGGNSVHELRIAMRAAYCSRLLGNSGMAFRRNGKQYFLTDWHRGVSLDKADQGSLKDLSIASRIELSLDLIKQVWILHKNGLIHCDIKPHNIIVSSNSIKLIDLDSVKLKNMPFAESAAYTYAYLDAQLNYDVKYRSDEYKYFDEKSDIYALGLSLSFLFPELFNTKHTTDKAKINHTNYTFEYETIKLTPGPDYEKHKELTETILHLLQVKELRPASCEDIFKALSKIYREHYKKEDPLPLTLQQDSNLVQAKFAFKEIERDIHEFNTRLIMWRSRR